MRLSEGCIAAAAAELRCFVAGDRGQLLEAYADGISSGSGSATAQGVVASVARSVLVAPTLVRLISDKSSGCLRSPADGFVFTLHDNRTMASGNPGTRWLSSCSTSSGAPAAASAVEAIGYLRPQAQLVALRCQLLSTTASMTSGAGGTAGGVARVMLAHASATALLLSAALPLPADVLVFRPLTGQLHSMRWGSSIAVGQLLVALAGRSGVPAAGGWQFEEALAAAAAAAAARATSPTTATGGASGPESSASGAAVAVTGSVAIAVVLDSKLSYHFPSVAQLALQSVGADGGGLGSGVTLLQCLAFNTVSALQTLQTSLRLTMRIGGAPANVSWVSPDGSVVVAITPRYADVCGTRSVCGSQSIQLQYEIESEWPQRLRRLQSAPGNSSAVSVIAPWMRSWLVQGRAPEPAAAASSLLADAAAARFGLTPRPIVACPPFCPGFTSPQMEPLAVPTAARDWTGSLLPAQQMMSQVDDASAGEVLAVEPADFGTGRGGSVSGGLLYTAKCSAAGFTDWETGACTNMSDPGFARCAFGSGDDCRLCPSVPDSLTPAAVCPGGPRAFTLPGFFTPAEGSGVVYRCKPPSRARCSGWNASIGAVQCGIGYAAGSPGCRTCADGWYGAVDGSCKQCPPLPELSPLLHSILVFLAAIAAVFGIVLAAAVVVARCAGGSVKGAFLRSLDLAAFVLIVLQVLAQVGQSLSPGMPEPVKVAFSFLLVLQAEQPSYPPACAPGSGYAFRFEALQMGAALALSTAVWLLMCSHSTCAQCCAAKLGSASEADGAKSASIVNAKAKQRVQPQSGGSAFKRRVASICALLPASLLSLFLTVLAMLYAMAVNTSFKMLSCQQTEVLSYALADLEGGPTAASASTGTASAETVRLLLLAQNPSFVCFSGSHAAVGWLAIATVAAVVVGFPVSVYCWARRRIAQLAEASLSQHMHSRDADTSGKVLQQATRPSNDSCFAAACGSCCSSVYSRGSVCAALREADAAAWRHMRQSRPCAARLAEALCGRERAVRWLLKKQAGKLNVMTAEAANSSKQARDAAGATALLSTAVASSSSPLSNARAVTKKGRIGAVRAAPPDSKHGTGNSLLGSRADMQPLASPAHARSAKVNSPRKVAATRGADGVMMGAAASPGSAVVSGLLLVAAKNTSPLVTGDTALRPFVGTSSRASALHARMVDMGSLAALAAVQIFWRTPQTAGDAAGRGTACAAALLTAAWIIGTRNPYLPQDGWKLWTHVFSLVLAALAAVLVHVSLAADLRFGSPPDAAAVAADPASYERYSSARTGLSYVVLAGCVVLLLILFLGYVLAAVRDARAEDGTNARAVLRQSMFVQAAAAAAPAAVVPLDSELARTPARLQRRSSAFTGTNAMLMQAQATAAAAALRLKDGSSSPGEDDRESASASTESRTSRMRSRKYAADDAVTSGGGESKHATRVLTRRSMTLTSNPAFLGAFAPAAVQATSRSRSHSQSQSRSRAGSVAVSRQSESGSAFAAALVDTTHVSLAVSGIAPAAAAQRDRRRSSAVPSHLASASASASAGAAGRRASVAISASLGGIAGGVGVSVDSDEPTQAGVPGRRGSSVHNPLAFYSSLAAPSSTGAESSLIRRARGSFAPAAASSLTDDHIQVVASAAAPSGLLVSGISDSDSASGVRRARASMSVHAPRASMRPQAYHDAAAGGRQ